MADVSRERMIEDLVTNLWVQLQYNPDVPEEEYETILEEERERLESYDDNELDNVFVINCF